VKGQALTPVFTDYIPAEPEPGNLYISMQFETAVHLCACGCRSKVVTPFGPHDWILTFDGTVSLRPSVGNGQQQCRSHYYVRNNHIDWLPQISAATTRAASSRDRAAHVEATLQPLARQAPWWHRIWNRIRRPRSTV
jgi:hypothetical protein